jgi:hypothetical protein
VLFEQEWHPVGRRAGRVGGWQPWERVVIVLDVVPPIFEWMLFVLRRQVCVRPVDRFSEEPDDGR